MLEVDYKSFSLQELQYIFSGMSFSIQPMRHQLACLAFATTRSRTAIFCDVGTGKTLISLWMLKLWGCKKTLVVAPSSAFGSWRRDLENHTNLSHIFLTGSGRDRRRELKKKRDVYIANYEGLKTIYCKLYKGEGWRIKPNSFIHDFDCIVLDEVHRCKVHDSLQSKICFELSKRAKHLVALTGTPIDQSYLELHNIFRIIDLGKSLGPNFFIYRHLYFDRRVCGSKWGRKWIEWDLKSGCEEKILDRISDTTLSFSREECFELPPIQKIFKFIHPTLQFLRFQEDVIGNRPLKFPGTEVLIKDRIKAKAHVLKELPSGFFYHGEDKEVCRLKKNPKVEALLDLLGDTYSKIVVFYWYTEERSIIEKALRREKISFCSAFGGQSHLDREKEIKKFSDDKNVKALVSQATCASEGFDAFVANVVIFFSPLSSPKMIKQCIGRVHRKGQKRKVLVITFVLEDSIEERIIEQRGERFNLVQTTMEYIRDFHSDSKDPGYNYK